MDTYGKWLAGIFLVVALVSLTIYISLDSSENAVQNNIRSTSATIVLNWIPDPTFAGQYIAKSRGYWSDGRDLDINISPGGFNANPIRRVAEGQAEFGVVGANRLLRACAKGIPVRAISLEMPDNPVGWIVHDTSDIHSYSDFHGHRIGQKFGTETESVLDAIIQKAGLNKDKMTIVPVQFSMDPFLNGQVDAFPVYVNEEPNTARAKGVDIRVLHPSTTGINMYGNVIITSEAIITNQEKMAEKFVAGLLRGWNTVITGSPKKISEELIRVEPEMGKVPTQDVLSGTIKLVRGTRSGSDYEQIGMMSEEGWKETHSIISNYSDVKESLNVSNCYTNKFVSTFYSQ